MYNLVDGDIMSLPPKLTLNDFIVERTQTQWGAPELLLTVKDPVNRVPICVRQMRLVSTQGHPDIPGSSQVEIEPGKGNGIFVLSKYLYGRIFHTFDMEEAITGAIEFVNQAVIKDDLFDRLDLNNLRSAVDTFCEAMESTSSADPVEAWAKVRQAANRTEVMLTMLFG